MAKLSMIHKEAFKALSKVDKDVVRLFFEDRICFAGLRHWKDETIFPVVFDKSLDDFLDKFQSADKEGKEWLKLYFDMDLERDKGGILRYCVSNVKGTYLN